MDWLNSDELRSFCSSALKVCTVELLLTLTLYLVVTAAFKLRKIVVQNRIRKG